MPEVTEVTLVMGSPMVGVFVSAGFVLALVLYLVGVTGRNAKMSGLGILIAGLTVLAADIFLFLGGGPPAQGEYRLAASDVVLVAVLGFLGGALSMLGASYLTIVRWFGRASGA